MLEEEQTASLKGKNLHVAACYCWAAVLGAVVICAETLAVTSGH